MSTPWLGGALLVLPAVYAALMLGLRRGWEALPTVEPAVTPSTAPPAAEGPLFSVLIAARNEADNLPGLLHDLTLQSLPPGRFEVLLADDHSTDATARLVAEAARHCPFPLRLVALRELPGAGTGKKAALQAALHHARAPWVVCTDADCRFGPDWLSTYAALVTTDAAVRFISGPVLLTGPNTAWQQLMGLEFAGLVGVGAAGIGRQSPTMCNGANLAYQRAAFTAVQGFAGNEHLASGDDEFLLHKLHAAFPGSIRFLRSPTALVSTAAPATLGALLRQRVRWASKWRHYRHLASQQLAVLVLGANVALFLGLLLTMLLPALGPWTLAAWALKLGADWWFLTPVLRFLGRPQWRRWLPVLQLLYAPYALATGLLGLRGSYVWKGRHL
ncbi:glycosyltransferase [Hymenobacter chitinivorans]|uniref:Cellulose synthase/poly-beta-1,6-N-acetylglucosamine synthase-like glycosyltransferase n=1 Tax=Hymenobacter chitinivorans DSM 11115 TaxID=1121954 RepID=A0A2M9BNP0_9BACT|nr:glycosyltransferase [Hymenobacter chitinivorans]PJJ59571.1 cellulose synthase/poly-beta-1,6-N-acetylglucosamine synthase-like glycosyltransferase [Hymenobacter chitinivorans DSM 11115]